MITTEIHAVMRDPSTSYWLRDALTAALNRDAFDALNDAEHLLRLLSDRLESIKENPATPDYR